MKIKFRLIIALGAVIALSALPLAASANHSWGNYHWARTSNPFTLKLGDDVSSTWDPYLATASSDWSASSVLDTRVVAGSTKPTSCKPKSGQDEICSAKYGFNGWLGLAQIWVTGDHITKAIVKVNDSYFSLATYNTPAWRRLVMCQEIGHTFGLAHQDENFYNANLGTCMDYTNNPSGPPSNEHPNAHDYEQLESIYAHLDSTTTVGQTQLPSAGRGSADNGQDEWGRAIRRDAQGRPNLFVKDLGGSDKAFTWVFWTAPNQP